MKRNMVLVAVVLVLSFGARMWVSAAPTTPPPRESLASFPKDLAGWKMQAEEKIEDNIAGVLKADDYVLRSYTKPGAAVPVDLFVAYYKTQKAGESMHSPKNCLPGWGWQILQMDRVALNPGDPENPALVNRYLVEKDGQRSLVFYWYQANGRMIASEYWGKVYLVWDALRTGRRDGAIVRFVVPLPKGGSDDKANDEALELARASVPLLPKYLPE